MSTFPVPDFPDWTRFVITIPPPIVIPPPPQVGLPGNSAVDATWSPIFLGQTKMISFILCNPHHTDGTNTGATTAKQDAVWVLLLPIGQANPILNGQTGGIYLPSPADMFYTGPPVDVYVTKAGEIAGNVFVSDILIKSTL